VETPTSLQGFSDLQRMDPVVHIHCDNGGGSFELMLTQGGTYTVVLYMTPNNPNEWRWSCTTFEAADGEAVSLDLDV
jgi:hypothetical protein